MVNIKTGEHVYAHLLCCMIALVIIRLIQRKIRQLEKPGKSDSKKKKLWEMGMPADRIKEALSKWMVKNLPEDYFRFCNINDPDLSLILKAHGITVDKKIVRRASLRSIRNGIKVI